MSEQVSCTECKQPEVPGVMFFKTDGEWKCRSCAGELDPQIEVMANWVQNKVRALATDAKNANNN